MKHYVLGKNASVFHDSSSGLTVLSAKTPTEFKGVPTKRMEIALQHGHIVEVDGKKAAAAPVENDLAKMDDKQLLAYYKENFEVSAEDAKTFKALSTEDKVKFLNQAEES